jgi:hypothetical protein
MGLAHSPSIISDGLVFYLDAANRRSYSGSGLTIYDLYAGSGSTLINGVGFSSLNSGFLSFDGTNDYISFGRRADLQGTNITLSAWAKFGSLTSGDVAILFGWTDGTNWRQGFGLGTYVDGIRSYLASIEYKASLNTWYYIATSSIGGSNNLYINGIGVSSSNVSIVYASSNLLVAGWGGPGYGSYSNCNVALATIHNRALSATEILQNYNATRKRFGL